MSCSFSGTCSACESLFRSFAETRYIFLNMFTGVVVQSFEYVFQRRGKSNLSREQIRKLPGVE